MNKPVVNVGFDGEYVKAIVDGVEVGRIKVPTLTMKMDIKEHGVETVEVQPITEIANATFKHLIEKLDGVW